MMSGLSIFHRAVLDEKECKESLSGKCRWEAYADNEKHIAWQCSY